VTLDTRQEIEVLSLSIPTWQIPLPPHSLEKVGSTEINTIQLEIKNRAIKKDCALYSSASPGEGSPGLETGGKTAA
jgi:hypothetical protein